ERSVASAATATSGTADIEIVFPVIIVLFSVSVSCASLSERNADAGVHQTGRAHSNPLRTSRNHVTRIRNVLDCCAELDTAREGKFVTGRQVKHRIGRDLTRPAVGAPRHCLEVVGVLASHMCGIKPNP